MSDERATPEVREWVALGPPHVARYLWASAMAEGKRVLDAGSGAGYGSALLARKAKSVTGVDLDAGAVGKSAERFKGVEFLVDDCQKLERVRGPFDVICNFENIEHLEMPELFLGAAARLLAADGVLLVSTPDRESTPAFVDGRPANPFHVMEWFAGEFAELLGRFFERVEMRVQVESYGQAARRGAVAALQQGIMWSNPVMASAWRKLGREGGERSWKALEGLAAGGVTDYPIVETKEAVIWGTSQFLVALCRGPKG